MLASNGGGELYVDTLKNKRARTVPLVLVVVPSWIGGAPARARVNGALRRAGGRSAAANWQRSVSWREAKATIGRRAARSRSAPHGGFDVAGVWRWSKVVQRVLGHARLP